jgi:MIP family channel proteins
MQSSTQRVHAGAPVKPARRGLTPQLQSIDLTPFAVNEYSRCLVGEFIGTLFLTWTHAGLALSIANTTAETTLQDARVNIAAVGIGSGLSLAGLVYGLGPISGAHLNPSVSLAFLLRGDMKLLSFVAYVLAQIAGGFVGAGILDAVFINDNAHGNLGANHPAAGFTVLAAFWMEFMGAFFLQLAILSTATKGRDIGGHAALAAGLTIGAMITYIVPYGGGSFNPARSLGPGVIANNPEVRSAVWIYIASPFGASIFTGLGLRWLSPHKILDKAHLQQQHIPTEQLPPV